MGVCTIVSVDGTTPDVATANRYGMRYVHMPIGYHGIDRERQLEIARAVRDLPGSVYIHCRHGRHCGPAAAATAAVLLNLLSADEGVAVMYQAGTSDSYPGLCACVQALQRAPADELEQAPADFPEISPLPGFVRTMAELQTADDHLIQIRTAGWPVPPDHPDLVPLA